MQRSVSHPPNNSSLTSLAAFSPSSRRFLSIIFDLSAAALSSALTVQPMAPNKRGVHRPLEQQNLKNSNLEKKKSSSQKDGAASSGVLTQSQVNIPALPGKKEMNLTDEAAASESCVDVVVVFLFLDTDSLAVTGGPCRKRPQPLSPQSSRHRQARICPCCCCSCPPASLVPSAWSSHTSLGLAAAAV